MINFIFISIFLAISLISDQLTVNSDQC